MIKIYIKNLNIKDLKFANIKMYLTNEGYFHFFKNSMCELILEEFISIFNDNGFEYTDGCNKKINF